MFCAQGFLTSPLTQQFRPGQNLLKHTEKPDLNRLQKYLSSKLRVLFPFADKHSPLPFSLQIVLFNPVGQIRPIFDCKIILQLANVFKHGRTASMSDNKSVPVGVKLLDQSMYDLARAIGGMDLDDPRRAEFIKDLYGLNQISVSLKCERNKLVNQRMDHLAHKVGRLKPGDPRRAQIVSEILRLSDLVLTK